MILRRKTRPEDGSYTNYLLDKGVEKICKKLGEETTEVIIVACCQSKQRLLSEVGDLTYHLLVLKPERRVIEKL